MERRFVTSTDFRNKAGQYLDEAAKAPVFITKHDRLSRVLLDVEEYERLTAADARRAKIDSSLEKSHEKYGSLYEKLAK